MLAFGGGLCSLSTSSWYVLAHQLGSDVNKNANNKMYSGIARFPRDSMAFLFCVLKMLGVHVAGNFLWFTPASGK